MMTKEGSTKIVNFMTPGAELLVLGCAHLSHIMKCVISSKIFLNGYISRKSSTVSSNDELGKFPKIVNFMTPLREG